MVSGPSPLFLLEVQGLLAPASCTENGIFNFALGMVVAWVQMAFSQKGFVELVKIVAAFRDINSQGKPDLGKSRWGRGCAAKAGCVCV